MSLSDRIALTRQEAAEVTGVSLDTIIRAIRSGELKAKRSGKDKKGQPAGKYVIPVKAIEAWIEGLEDA
jgi:excisionase family DNA binding protein